MKRIKFTRSLEGEIIPAVKAKAKPPAKYYQPEYISNYIRDRELYFYAEAVKNGDLPELERIAGYMGFEVRPKDKINVKI